MHSTVALLSLSSFYFRVRRRRLPVAYVTRTLHTSQQHSTAGPYHHYLHHVSTVMYWLAVVSLEPSVLDYRHLKTPRAYLFIANNHGKQIIVWPFDLLLGTDTV
jgi:hypothetical protein